MPPAKAKATTTADTTIHPFLPVQLFSLISVSPFWFLFPVSSKVADSIFLGHYLRSSLPSLIPENVRQGLRRRKDGRGERRSPDMGVQQDASTNETIVWVTFYEIIKIETCCGKREGFSDNKSQVVRRYFRS